LLPVSLWKWPTSSLWWALHSETSIDSSCMSWPCCGRAGGCHSRAFSSALPRLTAWRR
jgi:hypothetical protein